MEIKCTTGHSSSQLTSLLLSQDPCTNQFDIKNSIEEFIPSLRLLTERIHFYRRTLSNKDTHKIGDTLHIVQDFEAVCEGLSRQLQMKMKGQHLSISNMDTQTQLKNEKEDRKQSECEEGMWAPCSRNPLNVIYQVPIQLEIPEQDKIQHYLGSLSSFREVPSRIRKVILNLLSFEKDYEINQVSVQKQQKIYLYQIPVEMDIGNFEADFSQFEDYLINDESERQGWTSVDKSIESIKLMLQNVPKSNSLNSSDSNYYTPSLHDSVEEDRVQEIEEVEKEREIYQIPIEMKIVGNWRIENAYDIVIRAQDSIQADDLVSLKISNSNSNSNSNRVLQIVDEGSDDSVGSHKYNTYFNRMMTQTIQTSIHKNYEQSIDMSQLNDLNEKLLMLGEEKGDLMQSIRQHSRENMKLKEQLGQLRSMREQYVQQLQYMKQNVKSLQVRVSYDKKELELRDQRIGQLQNKLQFMFRQMCDYKNNMDNYQQSLTAQTQAHTVLKKLNKEQEKELEGKVEQLQEMQVIFQEQKAHLQYQVQRLQRCVRQLEQKLLRVEDENEERKQGLEKAKDSYEELMQRMMDGETLYELDAIRQGYEQQIGRSRKQIDSMIVDRNMQQEKYSNQIGMLRQEIDRYRRVNMDMKQRIDKLLQENRSLAQDMSEFKQDNNNLLLLNHQLKSQNYTLKQERREHKSTTDNGNNNTIDNGDSADVEQIQQLMVMVLRYEDVVSYLNDQLNRTRQLAYMNQLQLKQKYAQIQEVQADLLQIIKYSNITQRENRRLKKIIQCSQSQIYNIHQHIHHKIDNSSSFASSRNSSTIRFRDD